MTSSVPQPLTQVEVEDEIVRLSELLEVETHELAAASQEHAAAEADYRAAFARAFVAAEGAMPMRQELARLACAHLYRERRITEAKQLGLQEAGRNLRAQLDALRSINTNLRGTIGNASGIGR